MSELKKNISVVIPVYNSAPMHRCPSYLGLGAVIGDGAVVTKDIQACSVVAGNPARIIK